MDIKIGLENLVIIKHGLFDDVLQCIDVIGQECLNLTFMALDNHNHPIIMTGATTLKITDAAGHQFYETEVVDRSHLTIPAEVVKNWPGGKSSGLIEFREITVKIMFINKNDRI